MWRWIWLASAVLLVSSELAVPGTFILIPFGISAGVAAALAFAGAPVWIGWLVFVGLGAALFSMFWKMGRASMSRMNRPAGAGADRLLGARGTVVEHIPSGPSTSGLVRLDGETWRAVADGVEIAPDTTIEVVGVRGTRVIVRSIAEPNEKGTSR